MTDRLATHYLGLSLDNPFVPSSSPLTLDSDKALQMEDAGASAIVMHSLYEEEIKHQHEQLHRFMHHQDIGHHEADTFLPVWQESEYKDARDQYLEQIQVLKQRLKIPVIASLNGISKDGWIDHAKEIQQAGADALEMNIFYVPADVDETPLDVEERTFSIVREVRKTVSMPVTVKLSPQLSSPVNFVRHLKDLGVNGVSLFNRFYLPNINIDSLQIEPQIDLSTSNESLSRIHWIALVRGQIADLDLAMTGGVHTAGDALKALLAGADVTHVCSVLLKQGIGQLSQLKQELLNLLDDKEYELVNQLKGSLSLANAINPSAYERNNYLDVMDSYHSNAK